MNKIEQTEKKLRYGGDDVGGKVRCAKCVNSIFGQLGCYYSLEPVCSVRGNRNWAYLSSVTFITQAMIFLERTFHPYPEDLCLLIVLVDTAVMFMEFF